MTYERDNWLWIMSNIALLTQAQQSSLITEYLNITGWHMIRLLNPTINLIIKTWKTWYPKIQSQTSLSYEKQCLHGCTLG